MSGDFRPLMMTSNSCETVDETKEEVGDSVKSGPELSGEVETVEEQLSDEEEQDEDEESMHGKRSVDCNEPCEATDMNQCAVERSERGLVGHVRRKLKKGPGVGGTQKARRMFATVCVNNVNRSMAAHVELQKAGLRVCSFGGGPRVCFPGRDATSFRAFSFLISYETMYKKLREEDEELFTRNGVLQMLERDMQVKRAPQQWQQLTNKQLHDIDVIVCLDYQMFIRILNDLRARIRLCFQQQHLHVICLDVDDTPEDAGTGSQLTVELCTTLDKLPELSDECVKNVVVQFEKAHGLEMFYVGLRV